MISPFFEFAYLSSVSSNSTKHILWTRLDPQGMGCAAATWFLGRAQMWSDLVKFPVYCRHFSQVAFFPYILPRLFKKSKTVLQKCPKTGSEPIIPLPCFSSFSWYFWKTENPTSRFALLFKKFHRRLCSRRISRKMVTHNDRTLALLGVGLLTKKRRGCAAAQ